ncbi:MAG TPA: FHA domain-containing protein [Burkholderiales bacterium]|nr:FHA domain-containing protein [Burkholderiales bacterium]
MAKLILSLEGSVIREVVLDKERMTIGRKPQNDVQIENLAVSGEHACIVTILNDSFLEDLGSTNGTLVNGNSIKKHILQNNDVIEIGKYKLKYIGDAPAVGQSTVEDFEKTMVMRAPKVAAPRAFGDTHGVSTHTGGPGSLAAAAPPPVTAAPAPPVMRAAAVAPRPAQDAQLAAIQILTGPGAGKELELVKNLTTLGKPGVQVAVITRRPQGYFITHVEGATFPVLNGKTLDSQAHPLHDHDVVELAGVKMEFFLKK